MNFSEFEERLGAEPRETAETVEPGKDPVQDQAVAEALDFEERLEGALRVPVDEASLIDGLTALPRQRKSPPAWLALAASVLLVVGVGSIVWLNRGPSGDVSEYVRDHYGHDGAAVLARADGPFDSGEVQRVLASLGMSASPDLAAQVRYIKFCPTPDSQGAHMVLQTAEGKATVIFMPAVTVKEPLLLRVDGVDARVVGLTRGAAAIIGADADAAKALQASLETGMRPLAVDA